MSIENPKKVIPGFGENNLKNNKQSNKNAENNKAAAGRFLNNKKPEEKVDKLPLEQRIYSHYLNGEIEELRKELLQKYPHGWNPTTEKKLVKALADLGDFGVETQEFRLILIEKMLPYDLEKAPKELINILKNTNEDAFIIYKLIEKAKNGFNPVELPEIRKIIQNNKLAAVDLAKKIKDNYDLSQCPEFIQIIKDESGNFRYFGVKRLLTQKTDPKTVEKFPLLEDKLYFWYQNNELDEKLKKEYPDGWDPAAEDKKIKEMREIVENKNTSSIRLNVIKAMQSYDPTQFPEFVAIVTDKNESEDERQALAQKANPKDIEKLPLEKQVYFWHLRNELNEKIPNNWDPKKNKKIVEIITNKKENDIFRQTLAQKADTEDIENLPLGDKIYFWCFREKTINELFKKLDEQYPNGWKPTQEKKAKEIVANENENTDIRLILANKANAQDIEQLPSFKDALYFWYFRKELEEKLEKKYPDGWDPAAEDKKIKEMREIVENKEKNYKINSTYYIRDDLINKMQPYNPTQLPEFIKILNDKNEFSDIQQGLARKANSKDIEQLPSFKDTLYFWHLRGELEEKLEKKYPDSWDPAAEDKKIKEMVKIIKGEKESCFLRLALINKMKSYNPAQVPEFIELVKQGGVIIAPIVAAKANPKDIGKLPSYKDKLYFWYFRNELDKKIPDNWDPIKEKEIMNLIMEMIKSKTKINYCQKILKKADPKAIEKLPKRKKDLIFLLLNNEINNKIF